MRVGRAVGSCLAFALAVWLTGCHSEAPSCGGPPASVQDGPDHGMKLVPAGAFWRGCDPSFDSACERNENPGACVTLSTFEIDETEVTQEQYEACVSAGACAVPIGRYDPVQLPHRPVVQVTWDQAGIYCGWAGKRVPTAAEWEKAARGPVPREYPWGSTAPDCTKTNYLGCGNDSRDVGMTAVDTSPYGVRDMAGNVEEWLGDWYEDNYYRTGPLVDPPGPLTGVFRTIGGAGWNDEAKWLRVSRRDAVEPTVANDVLGIRCVKSLP